MLCSNAAPSSRRKLPAKKRAKAPPAKRTAAKAAKRKKPLTKEEALAKLGTATRSMIRAGVGLPEILNQVKSMHADAAGPATWGKEIGPAFRLLVRTTTGRGEPELRDPKKRAKVKHLLARSLSLGFGGRSMPPLEFKWWRVAKLWLAKAARRTSSSD